MFKVGDRVEAVVDLLYCYDKGDKGVIKRIDDDRIHLIRWDNGNESYCNEVRMKLIEENGMQEFTKDMLEVGMVVEYQDGDKRMVIPFKDELILIGTDGHGSLKDHNNELICVYEDLNIVKVYKATNAHQLSINYWNDMKLIWERPKKRTVTLGDKSFEISEESFQEFAKQFKDK